MQTGLSAQCHDSRLTVVARQVGLGLHPVLELLDVLLRLAGVVVVDLLPDLAALLSGGRVQQLQADELVGTVSRGLQPGAWSLEPG